MLTQKPNRMKLGESEKHKKTKDLLVDVLNKMLSKNKSLNWSFKDNKISNFSLSGNLLSNVIDIQKEYSIHTPFGINYRLDIVLLGPKIKNEHILLGGIEVEYNHEFESLKCLICKTMGFPLVCLDITEISDEEITEDWCKSTLVETTLNSVDDRRRNYIYIHNFLYPVYMNIPKSILDEERHQYIVFVKDDNFDKLLRMLKKLMECFNIQDNRILIQPVNCNNEQMISTIENEGSIAGHDWKTYNESRYIRVTLDKPYSKNGEIYRFHLAMARLLNCHFQTLVGYKYEPGIKNYDMSEHIWTRPKRENDELIYHNLLPKHVSEPVIKIMELLSTVSK